MIRSAEVEHVLDNFYFERVHEAMEALNWEWVSVGGVPTVEQLVSQARALLEDVRQSEDREISFGGFVARRCEDKDGPEFLELSFNVHRVSSEYF